MVKDVVKSIVEAESKAEDIIGFAREKASEIISAATADAEKIYEQSAKDIRQFMSSETKTAAENAEKKAAEFLVENKTADALFIEKSTKNMDKAVKVILESLLD
ncbi:MAG: V-type ATPase subunit subunit G family protein [Clostridia bacterium]|nr:V-type ATPase subunit subunit G family protein [Clostridia bacterium]